MIIGCSTAFLNDAKNVDLIRDTEQCHMAEDVIIVLINIIIIIITIIITQFSEKLSEKVYDFKT